MAIAMGRLSVVEAKRNLVKRLKNDKFCGIIIG